MGKIIAFWKRMNLRVVVPQGWLNPLRALGLTFTVSLMVYGMIGYMLTDLGVPPVIWLKIIFIIPVLMGFYMRVYWNAYDAGKHTPPVNRS